MRGLAYFLFSVFLLAAYPVYVQASYGEERGKQGLKPLVSQFVTNASELKESWGQPNEKPDGMSSTAEKLKSLLKAAIELTGADYDSIFGSYSEIVEDLKSLHSYSTSKRKDSAEVLKIVKKYLKRIGKRLHSSSTCDKVRLAGQIPEARLGHADIKLFGYPYFSEEHNATVLARQLPLNVLNGYLIPIKVGSRDYMVQGKVEHVIGFFECFGQYRVVAQTLFSDGHWSSKPHEGMEPLPLSVQVQGTLRGGSVGEILAREALEKVVRAVDVKLDKGGALVELLREAMAGDLVAGEILSPSSIIKHLRSYVNLREAEFISLVSAIVEANDMRGKLETFYNYMRRSQEGAEYWTQPHVVSHHKRVTVRLTTYPQPDRNNKATRRLGSSSARLAEVADVLREINWKAI